MPTPEALAKAMAGRDRVRLQPSGAYAANLLGLSEQVPAKVVFLTDGPSRVVQIGPMTLQLRRTTPRNMAAAGRPSGLVIQAFRHLGFEHITPERIARLRRTLPADTRRAQLKGPDACARMDAPSAEGACGLMTLAFLPLPPGERRPYIDEAAARRGLSPVIVEKDFWVCWLRRSLASTNQTPRAALSKGQANKWMERAEAKCVAVVRDTLAPEILCTIEKQLGRAESPWLTLEVDAHAHSPVLLFHYPTMRRSAQMQTATVAGQKSRASCHDSQVHRA